jgi:hypothetical protein
MAPYRSPRGRRRTTLAGSGGNGVQPAIDLAHSRALVLSGMPGNRRRSSMAADNSPSCSKVVRIAAASSSVTMNMVGSMVTNTTAGKPALGRLPYDGDHGKHSLMQGVSTHSTQIVGGFLGMQGRNRTARKHRQHEPF